MIYMNYVIKSIYFYSNETEFFRLLLTSIRHQENLCQMDNPHTAASTTGWSQKPVLKSGSDCADTVTIHRLC